MNKSMPVLINSLPKSGTNLVAKCLDIIGYSPVTESTTNKIFSLSSSAVLQKSIAAKLRRVLWGARLQQGYLVGLDSPVEMSRKVVQNRLLSMSGTTYCTGHLGYTDDILNLCLDNGIRPIVVIRDPRAVIASLVPFVMRRERHILYKYYTSIAEEDRYRAALKGVHRLNLNYQSMSVRCNAIQGWVFHEDVLLVKFEDLIGSKGGGNDSDQIKTISDICAHIGITLDSFDSVADKLFGEGKHTFRKGRIDSWKSEIPPRVIEEIESDLSDTLLAWGYR
ncbi:sulfotransferase domain-containing protein [Thiorhodovibrio frisius]|uniref:Sulfotransferase family protein n=1 Tax=Thiorhodovibrio frisius TaxID=631362 RepID=H8YYD9_9GAMM|nr:sulfotransferase domain-containing protein [Thiorhodovibrio frisius]EIC23465.1 sulfotransferase family protein [Thiorhodovibrio frisius]WPL23450.1 Sulfotransferase domain protein [Thiorhodovibrio frisius]